jgi:ABC-2 type transport system ATP-binding protein
MKPLPPSSPTVGSVPSSPRRRTGLLLVAVALVALLAAGSGAFSAEPPPAPALPKPRHVELDAVDGPDGTRRVELDATLYSPAETPAPAVLLAHGFGQNKDDSDQQAQALARRGFAVLTYSARGTGASTGRTALNSPQYEVKDAHQILDWMARQPEVLRDHDGDPRVGVTGSGSGGALSLLLAGSDPRVDAVAPLDTYNDLQQVLLPNAGSTTPVPGGTPASGPAGPDGVFKQAWAGRVFANARGRPASSPGPCGNLMPEVCAAYTQIARTGSADPTSSQLLDSVSPKSVDNGITAPTLLVQNERSGLFGVDQADANARQIAQAGAPVKVDWTTEPARDPRVTAQVSDWFAFHLGLRPPAPDPGTGFSYQVPVLSGPPRQIDAPAYPGLAGRGPEVERRRMPLSGPPADVLNPPGGSPAATSTLPGEELPPHDQPGQVAVFRGAPVPHQVTIAGAAQARITVATVPGQPSTGDAVLFAKLYDVAPSGHRALLTPGVAPLRVPDLPPDGAAVPVTVALPGAARSVEAGHHLELAVSTTDHAYAPVTDPSVHRVGLADDALALPVVPGTTAGPGPIPTIPLLGIGGILLFAALAWLVARIRRHPEDEDVDPDLAGTPLALDELTKYYPESEAVRGLSLRIERGQIMGMLGPNGAGKTTTLRVLLGLLEPTAGEIRVFGHRIRPGAPVLSRVGALVESPGFLPHLSGSDNLAYYWAATGRPGHQAHFDEVLSIAGIGEEAQRPVGTYSPGMQQRLAIAQAMLGLPDLLVLDEPTNRLDPPRIQQLREILRRYAASGRAVLLSSHLLSEVERTCTHVVVLHEGQLITSGSVADVVAGSGEVTFQVDQPRAAAEALGALEGIGAVEVDGDHVHADLAGHGAAIAVNVLVAAGVSVSGVGPRRHLEDAFLQLVGKGPR